MSSTAESATTPGTGTATDPGQDSVELLLTGMTCASCANRIERKLNKLDGVSATVNYATEKATVRLGAGVATDDLIAAVAAAGYTATLPEPDAPPSDWPVARRTLRPPMRRAAAT